MNMSIQNNLLAMNAERIVGITSGKKSKSTEKLSSGYRINRAADDAAGLAISEKMRRQIKGLTRGTRNAQDGISMCQIADGALNEVSDMMHRLTELSVQSANGTNDEQDRQAIQQEVNALVREIDRVADTTTFNEQSIFAQKIDISGENMSIEQAKTELAGSANKKVTEDIVSQDGVMKLTKNDANAIFASLQCYYQFSNIYEQYKSGNVMYDGGNGEATKKTGNIMLKFAKAFEAFAVRKNTELSPSEIVMNVSQPAIQYKLATNTYDHSDLNSAYMKATDFGNSLFGGSDIGYGIGGKRTENGVEKTDAGYDFCEATQFLGGFAAYATEYYYYTNIDEGQYASNHALAAKYSMDYDGEKCLAKLASSMKKIVSESIDAVDPAVSYYLDNLSDGESAASLYAYLNSDEVVTIYDKNKWWIQSGAEAGDGMYLEFDAVNARILGINYLNVSTQSGAEDAISRVKSGLGILSGIRSDVGAQQNRLEHTIKHQENTIENTQAAESQIRDADMAVEMVDYSNQNIIEQAGISMLSQANQQKQGILSLLQ